jgi:hypothetical protein
MDLLASSLERSPELFPFDLDTATDQIALIRLTEADYQRASFLDGRILTPQTLRRPVPWPQLEAAVAAARLEETASYIFHIGHAGSTLLSRLLGAHPHVFALREPAILRTLVQTGSTSAAIPRLWSEPEFDRRLASILKLLSRTFRPEQGAIVKTTSFVSELGAPILARQSHPKAIFMFVPAETYLATILGAVNSPKEARMLAESRLNRLHTHIGGEQWRLAALREGEMVAMSWACEMTALAAAAKEAHEPVLWLNFDRFLDEPAASLASAFRHFGIESGPAEIDAIISSPERHRYAKAPEHAYDSSLRRRILEQARREQSVEIACGLAWLDRAGAQSAAIASALPLR